MATINELIERFTAAHEAYVDFTVQEMECDDHKPVVKHTAIMSILGTENVATKKPHTYSSAEAIVETDAGYAEFLKKRRDVIASKMKARGDMEAAAFRVRAALALKGEA
jgi:hypothetical protein